MELTAANHSAGVAVNGAALVTSVASIGSNVTNGSISATIDGVVAPAFSGTVAPTVSLTAWDSLNSGRVLTDKQVTVNNAASPYTVLPVNQTIFVDTSGGAVTLTLPDPTQSPHLKN